MKWLPNQGSENKGFGKTIFASINFLQSTSQLTKLIICLIGIGVFLSGDVSKLKTKIVGSTTSQELVKQISHHAASISVKILNGDFLGSGFIVLQEGQKYTVITNQHVLRAGEAPYRIQTADGKTYSAKVATAEGGQAQFEHYMRTSPLFAPDGDAVRQSVAEVPSVEGTVEPFRGSRKAPPLQGGERLTNLTSKQDYDLAVLEFNSNNTYPTAKIGSSLSLEVGEPIYAAGFPRSELEKISSPFISKQPQNDEPDGFVLKSGRVAMILNQALEEGYQIGYTNNVQRGMSGGPLLNSQGEVVGINGKHAYPLWESPEIYQDGSQPCPALQDLITRSSLAIPIEKSIGLTPRLESLKPLSNSKIARKSASLENSQLVAKMQAEAEVTNQSCKKSTDEPQEQTIDDPKN